jgi:hypothetical protein
MPFVPFKKGGGKAPPKGKAQITKGAKGKKVAAEAQPNPFATKKTRRSPF